MPRLHLGNTVRKEKRCASSWGPRGSPALRCTGALTRGGPAVRNVPTLPLASSEVGSFATRRSGAGYILPVREGPGCALPAAGPEPGVPGRCALAAAASAGECGPEAGSWSCCRLHPGPGSRRNGCRKGLQRAVSCFGVREPCGSLRLVVFVGSPYPPEHTCYFRFIRFCKPCLFGIVFLE